MQREYAEKLLSYEAEEGAFMDARLGKQVDATRLANLRTALKILWLHYHEQEALPFSIAAPAAVLAYHGKEAADELLKSGHDRATMIEMEEVGRSAFDLLLGPEGAPVISAELRRQFEGQF